MNLFGLDDALLVPGLIALLQDAWRAAADVADVTAGGMMLLEVNCGDVQPGIDGKWLSLEMLGGDVCTGEGLAWEVESAILMGNTADVVGMEGPHPCCCIPG